MPSSDQCTLCANYLQGGKCRAFWPGDIPDEIFTGMVTHDKPYPGDKGFMHITIEEAEESFKNKQRESQNG